MNKLEQYKDLVITTNTETILANIDLIQKYHEKINIFKNHKYNQYFLNNIKRYEEIIDKLNQEDEILLKEIDKVKEMKEV